jgi:hypothetical protein
MTRLAFLESDAVVTGRGTLYRALRQDVRFRFAEVGGDGPEYEIVREDGTPDREGGVVFINPFEVPEGSDDAFLEAWDRVRATLAGRQGSLGARVHRSVGPADFRLVEIARWSSPLMVQRAAVPAAAGAMPFPSHPALYLPVRS